MATRRWALRRAPVLGTVTALAAAATVIMTGAATAQATPVGRELRIPATDWTSAAVGGIGAPWNGGGGATLTVTGVTGPVTGAYLAWNGIGPNVGTTNNPVFRGAYDNPTITVNGQSVTGRSQGESSGNCWGSQALSRTYLADVTDIVQAAGGNGSYALAGLGRGGDANGANLIVTYDDGVASDDRDLYLAYGDDSDAGHFPGEDDVWSTALTGLDYRGGTARLQLAVADGQAYAQPDDPTLNVTGDGGTVSVADDAAHDGLWDGRTVPDAGHSRAASAGTGRGSLYDLETFDVTGAFGAEGVQGLHLDAGPARADCHSLVMTAVDLAASGDQPPAPRTVSVAPVSGSEGTAPLPRGKVTKLLFKVSLSARSDTPTPVTLHTEDGTATSPSDYRGKSQTVVIPAGKLTIAFKVSVFADQVSEDKEYFYAVIDSAPVPVVTGTAVGQISDDDTTD